MRWMHGTARLPALEAFAGSRDAASTVAYLAWYPGRGLSVGWWLRVAPGQLGSQHANGSLSRPALLDNMNVQVFRNSPAPISSELAAEALVRDAPATRVVQVSASLARNNKRAGVLLIGDERERERREAVAPGVVAGADVPVCNGAPTAG